MTILASHNLPPFFIRLYVLWVELTGILSLASLLNKKASVESINTGFCLVKPLRELVYENWQMFFSQSTVFRKVSMLRYLTHIPIG